MPRRWTVALVVVAACGGGGDDRPSRHECEAALAHLIVLEAPGGTLCKYHPACDGTQRRRFVDECPRVMSQRELRCYQRATSLELADICLPRAVLDARIQGGGGTGPRWLGF